MKIVESQRVRSPRYPSHSLSEAEDMVRLIFNKDGMHPVDRESAASHLGFSSLNGASATALAALKQYGLTADAGKGMLKLTPLALDILEPENERSRVVALRLAAFSPELFASLQDRFSGSLPSESNLRAHLLRQGFTQAAIKSLVPAYLDTCEYLSRFEGSERTGQSADGGSESYDEPDPGRNVMVASTEAPERPSAFGGYNPKLDRRMVFDAEEGEVMFTYPDNLSEESVGDIEEWFALVVKRLRRAARI